MANALDARQRKGYILTPVTHDYLLKTSRPQDIVVHGESLGTAVAVDLACGDECGGVILEAAFTAASDVAGTVLPVIGSLLFRSFDSRRKITRVRAPILFIHGSADRTIPIALGRTRRCARAQILVPGGSQRHCRDCRPGVPEYLRSFYEGLAASPGE